MSPSVLQMVSNDEARSFITHAHSGGKIDPEGEGVEYSLIQPHDLERLCKTIIALRVDVEALSAASRKRARKAERNLSRV